MFKIDSVSIKRNKNANKKLYKNLKPGRYQFNVLADKLHWGEHVNIQAVVGKNGSGKSSLMDLLYMAINNVAYMFERGHHRAAAASLCYVKGLYVDIHYTLDDVPFVLSCKGDSVVIMNVAEEMSVASFRLNSKNATQEEVSDEKIRNIVKNFFYTIVSNYSLQSFISSNYAYESCVYNRAEHKDDEPEKVNSDGLPWNDAVDSLYDKREKIWLNSVFHKNDGYVRSLTLNPYRDNGVIDMEREKKLARYRLVALLIDGEKNKTNIFRDYTLDRICFCLDKEYVLKKFPDYSIDSLLEYVDAQLNDPDSRLSKIANSFDLSSKKVLAKSKKIALAYLQKKIDKVVENYDTYKSYRKNETYSIYGDNQEENLKKICNQIKNDPSHIVTKIKQTINFLSISETKSCKFKDGSISIQSIDVLFTYRWYSRSFVPSYSSLDEIITSFPPPIFKFEVYLNKVVEKDVDRLMRNRKCIGLKNIDEVKEIHELPYGTFFISKKSGLLKTRRSYAEYLNKGVVVRWTENGWEKDEINLSDLSSGELQMMQTLSTHAYHIRNLMSVKDDCIKYYNVNMVFDEVEICFHPEYQRQFISRLIAMLNALCRFKSNYNFNVFILTHSPFILSDIPSSNVMYLENGLQIDVSTQTFGQNISDLLNQNFFLDSFVGDFSKEKINSLIDFLLSKRKNLGWTKKKAEQIIEVIGDEFLKRNLKKKFDEVFR